MEILAATAFTDNSLRSQKQKIEEEMEEFLQEYNKTPNPMDNYKRMAEELVDLMVSCATFLKIMEKKEPNFSADHMALHVLRKNIVRGYYRHAHPHNFYLNEKRKYEDRRDGISHEDRIKLVDYLDTSWPALKGNPGHYIRNVKQVASDLNIDEKVLREYFKNEI